MVEITGIRRDNRGVYKPGHRFKRRHYFILHLATENGY